jgi:hypothetical protein
MDAFAGAYVVATRSEVQSAARIGLARIFRDEMQWRGLALALSTFTDSARGGFDPAELHALQLDTSLAQRELADAAALLRGPLAGSPRTALLPVLTALQHATSTPHQHRGSAVIADLDGDARPEILLETDARDRQLAPLLRAEPGLPQIATLDLQAGRIRALTPAPRRARAARERRARAQPHQRQRGRRRGPSLARRRARGGVSLARTQRPLDPLRRPRRRW